MEKDDYEIDRLFKRHEQTILILAQTLQVKRQYFDEISERLVQDKLEYASQVYQSLEKSRKKSKSTEFSLSDLSGSKRSS